MFKNSSILHFLKVFSDFGTSLFEAFVCYYISRKSNFTLFDSLDRLFYTKFAERKTVLTYDVLFSLGALGLSAAPAAGLAAPNASASLAASSAVPAGYSLLASYLAAHSSAPVACGQLGRTAIAVS